MITNPITLVVNAAIRKAGQVILPKCTTYGEKERVKEALKLIREYCEDRV